jgi:hypothetical protein
VWCNRLGELVHQYLLGIQFFLFQVVLVYCETGDSFSCYCSWLSIQISSFIIQNIYFSISFFNCTPLFCGFMLKFWYFISAIIFVWTVIFPSWSVIVYCCLLIVSIKVLIELSTHDGCLLQSFVKITLCIYNSNMCSTCLKRVQH